MLSIVTPVLNGEKFIEKNILEISRLKIKHEHIIVDGGSTDSTLQIISKYKHVRLIHQDDKNGMYSAINIGFKVAKGDYFTYINCDDIIIAENYDIMYDNINKNNFDLIYSDGYFKYSNLKLKYFKAPNTLFKYFLNKGFMPFIQPCSIFSKALYIKVSGFNYIKFKWAGDLDFFRKIAALDKININYLNIPTIYFSLHDNSLTNLNYDKLNSEKRNNKIPIPNFLDRIIFFVIRKLKL